MSSAVEVFNWNLRYFFSYAAIEIGVVAIQIFMWCYMLSRFRVTSFCPGGRETHLLYLVTSLLILGLTSVGAITKGISIYDILLRVVPGEDNVYDGWDILDSVYQNLWTKGIIASNVAFWIGDALLVYRCYVIWSNYPWAYGLPLLLWIANVGLGIRSFLPASSNKVLNIANVFLMVVLHLLITSLIATRLIHAHHRLSNAIPLAKHSEYLTAVAILIESAAPIALFGLGTAITGLFSDRSLLAAKVGSIFQICLSASATLAPQLIIFRVATGRSWARKSESQAILSRDFEAVVGELDHNDLETCATMADRSGSLKDTCHTSRTSL